MDEIKYDNMEGINSLPNFMTRIRGSCPNDERYFSIYRNKKLVYILDNCDGVIEKLEPRFSDYLKKISNNTNFVKFIIITLCVRKLEVAGISNICLGPLDEINAAKFLLAHIKDQLPFKYHSPEEFSNHFIIKNIKRSPKDLLLFAENFQINPDLGNLEERLRKNTLFGINKVHNDFNSIEGALK